MTDGVPSSEVMSENPSTPAGRSGLTLGLAATLAIVLAALAVLSGVEFSRAGNSTQQHAEMLRASALSVANQEMLNFASLDYRNLTQDFANIERLGDTSFRTQYTNETNGVAELIVKAKASSKATIASSAVQDANSTQADVIVAVDEFVTSAKYPKGLSQSSRFRVTLKRQNGPWQVDAVNYT